MTSPIGLLAAVQPPGAGSALVEQATHLLEKASSVAGAPDLRRLADDVIDIAEAEPAHAADLLAAMKPQLSATERQRLAEDMARSADARAARRNKDGLARAGGLVLDIAQLALSIGGTIESAPPCDTTGGVVAPPRGDHVAAAIGALGMIPHAGDVTKAGRIRKVGRRRKRGC